MIQTNSIMKSSVVPIQLWDTMSNALSRDLKFKLRLMMQDTFDNTVQTYLHNNGVWLMCHKTEIEL